MIRYDETDNLSLIVNYLINTNDNWMSIITQSKILINNEFQTIDMYLTQSLKQLKPRTSSSKKKYFVSKSNVLHTLNFMYTALKCEYAYLIRDILKCIHLGSIDTFISLTNLCKHLGKVIFNLFNFKELSEDLKSSDQTLTISLLSIRVFLYKENISYKKENNILQTKWIHQMISLMEIFICKMCFYTFSNLDTQNSKEVKYCEISSLNNYLSQLKKLSQIGLYDDKYTDSDDIYNPYNFLMCKYTNDSELYNLMIASPSVSKKTKDIFGSLISSYDIKNVLINQIFLIESFRSLFCLQIMDVLKNTSYDSKKKISELNMLYHGFNKYMDFIPDNYPPIFLNVIYDIKNALTDYLQSGGDNFKSLNDKLNIISSSPYIIHLKTKEDNTMSIISTINLIKNIKESPYFPSFKQTFEILLQEPSMLKDYNLIDKTNDDYKIASYETGDKCLMSIQIRERFIMIRMFLDKKSDKVFAESFDSYFTTIVNYINYLYEFKNTKSLVKKNLLNVLNHANNLLSQSLENINSSKFVILKQLILSTIITMDYQEPNKCEIMDGNSTLYGLFLMANSLPTINIKEEIHHLMKEIGDLTGHPYTVSHIKKGQTYIDEIKSLDKVDSDRIKIYRYVYEKQVLNMCQDLYQHFKTPDINQINHRFQLTVLEQYLYQAYTQVVHMFQIKNKPSNEQIVFIKKALNTLRQSLTFSTYIMRIVLNFINIYVDYFKNKTIDQESISNFTNILHEYKQELQYPYVSINNNQQIEEFYNLFKTNIEFIKYYFIDINNNKFIIDENDLTVTMFMEEINMICKNNNKP